MSTDLSSLLKTDLSDDFTQEYQEYYFLKMKGNNRTTSGSISWPSTSSGATYTSTTGEQGLMQALATALYNSIITADNWNIVINALFTQPTLNIATLLNGWQQDTNDTTPGYRVDSAGTVHLQGTVIGGQIGTTIFQLPTIYAPTGNMAFPCSTGTAGVAGEVSVNPNGFVFANNPIPATGLSWNYLSLNGISFIASSFLN